MSEAGRLRAILRLYAESNDCPVCFAVPRIVDADVTTYANGNQTVIGGRWHVEHGLSCDVRRALQPSGNAMEKK